MPDQSSRPLLALDASATASVAVVQGGEVLARYASTETNTHAEVLTPAVRRVLEEAKVEPADLRAVVAGVGPGPFTGLRAGLVTARSLAFAWGLPVHGVMSLDAIALPAAEDAFRAGVEEFVVATDARRREVYWAHYASVGGQFQRLHGPFVTAPDEVTPLPAYGAGAGLYPEALAAVAEFSTAVPDAGSLGLVGELALRRGRGILPVQPLYLRESDAKVPGPRKKAGTGER
ncbi:tRNA (adenosine(37)-N6)-threonylcarbamoyltransferase complex dimerization subunit type 1 TsaB [Citricoccus zhacaiensis]|uniref:tRNA (Adenosine(37)-N6)-threonylcarbamoyltransferase complex dimerization subunit type 1 TsaB n=1 Tax=Citricoccus zhacaiensis TaxID=489142 RepID=A0ABQ2LZH3_9MICC|nr:tRNA (adenosine(37)-N6)-threonylcarbamoyltransferase complex dimerization subunit type 1 TsaB [Citricoccus zhacaiensis]GGO45305.1 tRNA (adenosine(37)-N6)-threonylcarbamoyltransferase complex dimerization subunit type 1 TsaB [Citricoccus zhacaiensis]